MESKVLHLNFSESGGAGRAATRLVEAQNNLGWQSDLLTAISSDLRTSPLRLPLHTIAAVADEYLVKKKDFSALFSYTRDRLGSANSVSADYDVYNFHWVNGLVSFSESSFLSKKAIVWTLHDMNSFTGGCHYSLGCEEFSSGCRGCPAVNKPFQSRIESRLERKGKIYKQWSNLQVVAPSEWLAREASRSLLFRDVPIAVIPTSLDPIFFTRPKSASHASDEIEHPLRLAIVAAQLDSPVKNVDSAVQAFTAANSLKNRLELVLIGKGGFKYQGMPGISHKGPLTTPELIDVLDEVDYIIIPSIAENSPLVVWEAASRGVIPLANNVGGLPEVVSALQTGFVYDSGHDLAQLLSGGLVRNQALRRKLEAVVRKLTDPKATAAMYLNLYESMI